MTGQLQHERDAALVRTSATSRWCGAPSRGLWVLRWTRTPASARSCSTVTEPWSGRGSTAAPGARTPRSRRWPRRPGAPAAARSYVTLEPCNHTGRTGPCAQALVDAGVRRVVHAQADPGAASGGGADTLRAAGVEVVGGVLAEEALALNQAWTFAVVHGRPRVTWKFAATLDGRSAAADGSSAWITGPLARADVHELRAGCGAVLVGTGTVLADDPHLTVRRPDGSLRTRQPLRTVMGLRAVAPASPRAGRRRADRAAAHPRPGARPCGGSPTVSVRHVLARGRPHPGGGLPARRAGRRGREPTSRRPCSAPVRAAVGDLGIPSIDRTLRLTVRDVRTIGPDVRVRATTSQGEPLMFTGIVEELGEIVAIERGADSAVLRVRGPLVVSDATHGALDQRQRRLPDGGRARRRELQRRRHGRDARPQQPRRPRAGVTVNLERAMAPPTVSAATSCRGTSTARPGSSSGRPGTAGRSSAFTLPARGRPLRRGEGLDHGRRRLAHRRRPSTPSSFSVSLIPTTLGLTTLGPRASATRSTWRST